MLEDSVITPVDTRVFVNISTVRCGARMFMCVTKHYCDTV